MYCLPLIHWHGNNRFGLTNFPHLSIGTIFSINAETFYYIIFNTSHLSVVTKNLFCRKNFSSHLSIGTKKVSLYEKTFLSLINWQKKSRFEPKNFLPLIYWHGKSRFGLTNFPHLSIGTKIVDLYEIILQVITAVSPDVVFVCLPRNLTAASPRLLFRVHRTVISPSDGYSVVKGQISPHLLPVGKAVFSGVLKNFFVLHLFPLRSSICTPIFKKYLSSYIGLLKKSSEINPREKLFSPLLYRNFFASKLNQILKKIFLFTTYANPEVISGGIC